MRDPFDTGAPRDGEESDDEEWDDVDNDVVHLKYISEGATTIAELSASLRRLADELDRQRAEGWRLAALVDGGYAHLTREKA